MFYYGFLMLVGNEAAPRSTAQTVFSSLVIIAGSIIFAFIFGNMAALMASMNQKESAFQDQMDRISNIMKAIKLPEPVQAQVEEYLIHIQSVPDMHSDLK